MLNRVKDVAAYLLALVQRYPAATAGLVQVVATVAALEGVHLSLGQASVVLSLLMAALSAWVHSSVSPVIKR